MRCVEVNFVWRNMLTFVVNILWFCRNIMCVWVCVFYVKYLSCAVEILWLVLNDLCAG